MTGDPDFTVKFLKAWAIQGCSPDITTKDKHMKDTFKDLMECFKQHQLDLPDDATQDAQVAAALDELAD